MLQRREVGVNLAREPLPGHGRGARVDAREGGVPQLGGRFGASHFRQLDAGSGEAGSIL